MVTPNFTSFLICQSNFLRQFSLVYVRKVITNHLFLIINYLHFYLSSFLEILYFSTFFFQQVLLGFNFVELSVFSVFSKLHFKHFQSISSNVQLYDFQIVYVLLPLYIINYLSWIQTFLHFAQTFFTPLQLSHFSTTLLPILAFLDLLFPNQLHFDSLFNYFNSFQHMSSNELGIV